MRLFSNKERAINFVERSDAYLQLIKDGLIEKNEKEILDYCASDLFSTDLESNDQAHEAVEDFIKSIRPGLEELTTD